MRVTGYGGLNRRAAEFAEEGGVLSQLLDKGRSLDHPSQKQKTTNLSASSAVLCGSAVRPP